jgi:transcriptional regulator with XRE-family HTH domain
MNNPLPVTRSPEVTFLEGEKEPLCDRLRLLIGPRGTSEIARKCGLSDSVMRKYLAGSEPSRAALVKIARGTNTNLVWLATGEGLPVGPPLVRDPDAYQLNREALHGALDLVETVIRESSLNATSTTKADVVIAMYDLLCQVSNTETVRNKLGGLLSSLAK